MKKYLLIISLFVIAAIAVAQPTYLFQTAMATAPDNRYELGQEAVLRIVAHAGGVPLDGVEVAWEAGNDMMPTDTTGKAVFKKGEALVRFGTMHQPGFRYCKYKYKIDGESHHDEVKVAFAPEQLQSLTPMPADFQQFWRTQLKRQQKLPVDLEVTPCPDYSTDKINVSVVRLQCGRKGRYIYGFLVRPNDSLRHPAVLVPPGAGVNRNKPDLSLAKEGFVALHLEIHGISPLLPEQEHKQRSMGMGDYWYHGIEHRDSFYYRDVILGCHRAVDYLLSLPYVDTQRIAAYGGSQGGALTMITTALHPAIRCLVAYSPAMCDMTGFRYGRAGGWPRLFQPARQKEQTFNWDAACQTVQYYDVANFARLINVPGFYAFGYNDRTCPPTSMQAALNGINAPKTFCITPRSAHWSYPATKQKGIAFLKRMLTGWRWVESPSKSGTDHVWYRCTLDRLPDSIRIASVGYHELYIDGQRMNDYVLAPVQSRLDKRIMNLTYDVRGLKSNEKGKSHVVAVWYAPGWSRFTNYKPYVKQGFYTDLQGDWRYKISCSKDTGEKKYKDMGGELFDARQWDERWCTVGYDDADWTPASSQVLETIPQIITPQRCPPTRILQFVNSKSSNSKCYDFGRNFTGWISMNIKGTRKGDTIRYRLSDDPQGKDDFLQWNYHICRGGKEHVQNHFNYMAGRWLFIEGLSTKAKITNLEGLVVGTDLKQISNFHTTDTLLQRIYDTDLWTFRQCTTEGYTSDCPHRERLGYGEVATACSWAIGLPNYDARDFYKHVLQCWIDTQQENGRFMYTAPQMWGAGGAMWASAPLNIAWEAYQTYHDREFLTMVREPARRWLDFLHSYVKDGVLTPYHPHRMHFLGDWATTEGGKEHGDSPESHFFNNCVYVWNLRTYICICNVLGLDATVYQQRLDALIPEITRHFYHPDKGYYSNGLQVPQAFALWQNVVPDSIRPRVEQHFRYQLTTAQPYLGMGSSGLIPLLHYLCEHPEYDDIVLEHLHKTTQPSYGYFLSQGETTWPEYWTNDVPSKIHTCYTGVSRLIRTILERNHKKK